MISETSFLSNYIQLAIVTITVNGASVAFREAFPSQLVLASSHDPAADLDMASRLWICVQVLDLLEDACTGLLRHIQEHDLQNRAAQVV